LCLEKLDASALVSEVGLEATEDDGCGRAEVEDLGIPLRRVSKLAPLRGNSLVLTLSKTFSREFGQSIAKQTKSRSVSG
jgi:hypothetical protein